MNLCIYARQQNKYSRKTFVPSSAIIFCAQWREPLYLSISWKWKTMHQNQNLHAKKTRNIHQNKDLHALVERKLRLHLHATTDSVERVSHETRPEMKNKQSDKIKMSLLKFLIDCSHDNWELGSEPLGGNSTESGFLVPWVQSLHKYINFNK